MPLLTLRKIRMRLLKLLSFLILMGRKLSVDYILFMDEIIMGLRLLDSKDMHLVQLHFITKLGV